ncbi:hypothetical protein TNIN_79101 [Trichonephila inaurata madagascariensis]|uniref:Uncharacterized protein n=1 Tax=Trichonephila inaurata madagascariensis TaxID=2747483 RepID=A0A8X6XFG5_9ARAC|nr:hypothetical protein TNIN_79101 [Trichonephila inaurata madagascariensis]
MLSFDPRTGATSELLLHPLTSTSHIFYKFCREAARETCEDKMTEAVREVVDENEGKKDLAVAIDGSRQK